MMGVGASVLAATGRAAVSVAATAGLITQVLAASATALVRGQVPVWEVLRQVYICGAACLPVTAFASVCVGLIVAVQGMAYVQRYSAPEVFGWAAYFSSTREVGPLLMGLTLSARLGAFHAAELAAWVVTDRVNALRALSVSPVAVLAAPRLLAMPVCAALLMAWSDACALVSATLFAWLLGPVSPWTTWASIAKYARFDDLVIGLQKAAVYGFFSGATAVALGLSVHGGADAVGTAVTRTAVTSLLLVAAAHHALTVWTAG
jgi:phospholipid/cholesterol/gamma-HCH transport system permease protein